MRVAKVFFGLLEIQLVIVDKFFATVKMGDHLVASAAGMGNTLLQTLKILDAR
jgi:hypothetical protein